MESQRVEMTLKPETVQLINNMTAITGATSGAQLIVTSLELTDELIKTIQNGGKIYIENKDGSKQLLKLNDNIKI